MTAVLSHVLHVLLHGPFLLRFLYCALRLRSLKFQHMLSSVVHMESFCLVLSLL